MNTNESNIMVAIFCMTYNQASYIKQTLDSILIQKTTFSFIIVIHDDASTDGTIDIIKEYHEKYPKIIRPLYEKENLYHQIGYQGVFKMMIPYLDAKYVATCDGDDYWIDPFKLQKQVDFLESHLDYSMCFHSAIEHYEDNHIPDHIFAQIEDRDYTGVELNENWICASSSVVIRREIYNSRYMRSFLNNPRLINEDTPTFLSAAALGKIRGMSEVMNVYRKQPQGLSYAGIPYEKLIKWGLYEYEIYKVFGEKYKQSAIRKAVNTLAGKCFIDSLSQGKFRLKPLFLSFGISPTLTLKLLFNHYSQSISKRIK